MLLGSGFYSNSSYKITTSIVKLSSTFRYKISIVWQTIPSVRSYDILGIGINSNVKVNSAPYFSMTYCYSVNNCKTVQTSMKRVFTTGAGVTFKWTSENLTSANAYFYFDVSKNTNNTLKSLSAYGAYANAEKNVSVNVSDNYSVNSLGINLNSTYLDSYNRHSKITASWTGSW